MTDIDKQLERLYTGTLICPYKGCYESDPVRYINKEVLADHIRIGHTTTLKRRTK